MFQKITQRYIALLFGAFCVSMGYVISVPFLMTETLGGAKSAPGSLILGILLLAAGATLLIRGLYQGRFTEWLKLLALYLILLLTLSVVSGKFAVFVLSITGGDAKKAKMAADLTAAALSIPLHAWMLGILGHLSTSGTFVWHYPIRSFGCYLILCCALGLIQRGLYLLPQTENFILLQAVVSASLLWFMLYVMMRFTEKEKSRQEKACLKETAGEEE